MRGSKQYPLLIAVTGPESTGKSSMVHDLSQHYHCPAIPEYAREYLSLLDRPYNYDDVLEIAKGQKKMMDDILDQCQDDLIIFDTELTVARVWCEFKYNRCHPWILDQQKKQKFDHYLLMDIDLSWQPDPLREHPDDRKELFEHYMRVLNEQHWPFDVVSGQGSLRLEKAIAIIDKRLK